MLRQNLIRSDNVALHITKNNYKKACKRKPFSVSLVYEAVSKFYLEA